MFKDLIKNLPEEIIEYSKKFRNLILSENYLEVNHHIDGDGIASGSVLSQALDMNSIENKNFPVWFSKIEKYISKKNPIFLDIPHDFLKKHLDKYRKFYVIDHHRGWNKKNNIFCPHHFKLNFDPSNLSTGILVYLIFPELEEFEWKVMISAYTDRAVREEFIYNIFKENLEKFGEEYLATISVIQYIGFKEDPERVNRIFNLLKESKNPKDFIYNCKDEDIEFSLKISDEIKNILEFWESYKIREENDIVLLVIESEFNLASPISTLLAEKYPEKIWIVFQKKENGYKGSVRCLNGRVDVGYVLKNIKVGRGGGHKMAGGVSIFGSFENVLKFYDEFLKFVKNQNRLLKFIK